MRHLLHVALLVAVSGYACADTNTTQVTVRQIFSENATTAGFYPSTASVACPLYYIDLSTQAGQNQFAMLLMAKAKNMTIPRVDYTVNTNAGNSCWITGLHVCKAPDCVN
jgi:hypothetical protein